MPVPPVYRIPHHGDRSDLIVADDERAQHEHDESPGSGDEKGDSGPRVEAQSPDAESDAQGREAEYRQACQTQCL